MVTRHKKPTPLFLKQIPRLQITFQILHRGRKGVRITTGLRIMAVILRRALVPLSVWMWGIIQTHHQRSPEYQTLSPSGRVQSAVWCCSPSPRSPSRSTFEGLGSCLDNPDSELRHWSRTEPRCLDTELQNNGVLNTTDTSGHTNHLQDNIYIF